MNHHHFEIQVLEFQKFKRCTTSESHTHHISKKKHVGVAMQVTTRVYYDREELINVKAMKYEAKMQMGFKSMRLSNFARSYEIFVKTMRNGTKR